MYSGICKSYLPVNKLVARGQTGIQLIPLSLTRFIGVVEILGAVGLILPWLLQIYPVLTPVSAVGFAIVMVLAAPLHYKLKEPKGLLTNFTFFSMGVAVAWGRFAML